jgi:hypothetical protein
LVEEAHQSTLANLMQNASQHYFLQPFPRSTTKE